MSLAAAGQCGEAMRTHGIDDRHAENQQHERHREATTHQHVAEHPRRHVPELTKPTPYGDRLDRGAAMARSRKPANAGRGHSCRKFLSLVRTRKTRTKPNRTPFHLVTGLQHVEGSSNSRYQVVLAKDPSYFPKTQPGPKCSSTDVEPAAPETQPLQLATQSQRRATRCNACR